MLEKVHIEEVREHWFEIRFYLIDSCNITRVHVSNTFELTDLSYVLNENLKLFTRSNQTVSKHTDTVLSEFFITYLNWVTDYYFSRYSSSLVNNINKLEEYLNVAIHAAKRYINGETPKWSDEQDVNVKIFDIMPAIVFGSEHNLFANANTYYY